MNKNPKNTSKTFTFETEVESLLNLLANSLYSNPEIFLRELISNSADSLSKLKYIALTDPKILGADEELSIKIKVDEKTKEFSIYDNGLGMSKDELIKNLGSIAKSGTLDFFNKINKDKKEKAGEKDTKDDIDFIGKFGVGFYSVFMVADEITVLTYSRKTKQGNKWNSDGKGTFTIEKSDIKKPGTTISFKFKKKAEELASNWRLEQVIKQHSNFIPFLVTINGKTVGNNVAPWTKHKSSTTNEEYNDLYKYLTHNQSTPLFTYHYHSDAPLQFDAVLFVGKEVDNNLFQKQINSKIQLYSNRVFIQDNCEQLAPTWLRFINGVVDSHDLPLNVSRQTIQDNPIINKIKNFIVKKLVSEWNTLKKNDFDKFQKFWNQYGIFIKEGIYGDYDNREKLTNLFHGFTSNSKDKLVSLQQYVENMNKDQTEIYYHHGKNIQLIESSPQLEYFKHNNIEVFYLYDEVDDFVIGSIGKYKEKNIVRIDQSEINIKSKDDNTDKKDNEIDEIQKNKLQAYFKDILKDKVQEVIGSDRLIDSPCMLVSPKDAPSIQVEQLLKSMNKDFNKSKRILALNFNHPILINLAKIQNKFPQESIIKESIELMYDNCVLSEKNQDSEIVIFGKINNMLDRVTKLKAEKI